MSRLSNIQEILWVSTPELIFFSSFSYTLTSSCILSPFTLELLFNGRRELSNFDVLRSENSQKEWSFLILFIYTIFSIRYYHIMHIFLIMNWMKSCSFCNFSLTKSLKSLSSFKYYIILIYFP
jgi:hypothetical protein